MSKRMDQRGTSTRQMKFLVTPEEGDGMHALAQYLGESLSEMIRRLYLQERARVVAEGKRPPLRPRD